ncbi:hypothetical protein IMZ08_03705 [Bacillus luteolus]|uniref:Uncharacterized protein n=1 Tax=Litchfieldia luteola TaxID=682179 RepID=A0ABR9QF93_9BACI|nr:hypothetical protein [Cytobacillus luteolus]MBE4907164.1 hypothetical protein [Cytobacillus luteolus]MBP1943366.1 hypothetical protein [Cytobacillus luteolus]
MMNFIKKMVGQGKNDADCCGIEIKEVNEEVQVEKAEDTCCETTEKKTESCCG